jgi:hypothetical protein
MIDKLKENNLFLKLKELETAEYGDKNFPISNNIENHLFKVTNVLLNGIQSFMPEYTLHDVSHSIKILDIIEKILPSRISLNIVELQILIYATFLHDIGMVINRDEANDLKTTNEFEEITMEFGQEAEDEGILTELIRRTHVQRSLKYVDKFKNDFSTYKIDFLYNSIDISLFIKAVIESHELPVKNLKDTTKYPTNKLIDNKRVNIQFLAILLRLGDIMDFDIQRTPYFLFKHIGIKNQTSLIEWKKHMAIDGVEITENMIEYQATCTDIGTHRKIEDFLGWIEFERKESVQLLDEEKNANYYLNLKEEVKYHITPNGYIYNKLELHLDYEKVLNILMGTNLYDSVDIFLRELLQNSYDACKYKKELEDREGESYTPSITIKYSSLDKTLEIIDNGIGIDEDVFKNYVISIGQSYYKSKYFQRDNTKFKPVSNFGIGIISCFMISDSIEIESKKDNKSAIHYILHVKEKYIEQKVTDKKKIGTSIKLKLHDDYIEKLKTKSIEQIIEENMAYQPIPITLKADGQKDILLHQSKIELPENYELSQTSDFIEFDNDDELEGYIVLSRGHGEQGLFGKNKIAQQYFVITGNGTNINLAPSWLRQIIFNINIPDKYKIQLKASRTKVELEDENLLKVRDIVLEKIIQKFEELIKQSGINAFFQYADDGRGRQVKYTEKEYNFLINLPLFQVIDIKNTTNTPNFLNISFYGLIQQIKEKEKIAVIRQQYLKPHYLQNIFQYLQNEKYSYIMIDRIGHIHYFYQLIQPFTKMNSVMISENIEGFAFNSITLDELKDISHSLYTEKYSWTDVTENIEQNYFLLIGNNNYNGFGIITFNKSHRLGILLESNKKKIYVQGFQNSIENAFTQVLFYNQKLLSSLNWDIQKNYFFGETNNNESYARIFIRCLDDNFLNSMNKILEEKVLNELVKEQCLAKDVIKDFLLTKSDFPSWYFVKNN